MTLHVISTSGPQERRTHHSLCGSCGKRLAPGTESVAFRAHHARCIERALARVRNFS